MQFFLYETPKVLLLRLGVVFVMGIIHTCASPERTHTLLAGRRLGVDNVLAAGLGIGRLGMDAALVDEVRAMQNSQNSQKSGSVVPAAMPRGERIASGVDHVRKIVGKVWPFILAGIVLGAGIHG